MTRETKFRAWDKERKSMEFINCKFPEDILRQSQHIKRFKNNLIWMQFTGLKDKNGKEIYEGDIINMGDALKPFLVKDIRIDTLTLARMIKFRREHENAPEFKIIGNKFKNPELLEKSK